jgi:hypothetical protein
MVSCPIGVSVIPGATQLTRTCGASSRASDLVRLPHFHCYSFSEPPELSDLQALPPAPGSRACIRHNG